MQFYTMVHTCAYTTKEYAVKQTGYIKNTLLKELRFISLTDLAGFIAEGRPFILGKLAYTADDLQTLSETKKHIAASDRHWQEQQLFGIDVDNEGGDEESFSDYLTISAAIARCQENGVTPALVATTYSYKKEHHKFRMFFMLDRSITSREERDRIIYALIDIVSAGKKKVVDSRCKDASRIFFGSAKENCIYYSDPESTVSAELLLNCSLPQYTYEAETAKQSYSKNCIIIPRNNVDRIKQLELFDENAIRGSWLERIENARVAGQISYQWKVTNKSFIKEYTQDSLVTFQRSDFLPITALFACGQMQLLRFAPLDVILGIEIGESFSCILPGHTDKNPSARLELRYSDSSMSYHCYGCGLTLDPIDIVQRLAGCSLATARNYLCDLLGLERETESIRQRKAELARAQEYILMDLPTEYPKLHSFLRRRNLHVLYHDMHTLARQLIYDIDDSSDHYIIASTKLIQTKLSQFYGRSFRPGTLAKRLKLLAQLGLIRVVSDEECPPVLLGKLKKWQFNNRMRYRPTVYVFPLLTSVVLQNASVVSARMVDKHMRTKYYNRGMVEMAEGKESAKAIYVQDECCRNEKELERFYAQYCSLAQKIIAEKSWFTEKELVEKLRGYSFKKKEFYSGMCLPKLLDDCNLCRVTCTNAISKKLSIQSKKISVGHTKIILSKEVLA